MIARTQRQAAAALFLGWVLIALVGCLPDSTPDPGDPGPEARPSAQTAKVSGQFVYLTWSQVDTARSMTVNFSLPGSDYGDRKTEIEVRFEAKKADGNPANYSRSAPMQVRWVPGVDRAIASADLSGLQPATRYHFVISQGTRALTAEGSFRTMPADSQAIRLVAGGDMDAGSDFAELSRLAAKESPDAALIGGDIAYDFGLVKNFEQWEKWFQIWAKTMVTPDGRMIPMIVAIGNAEVDGGFGKTLEAAPLFAAYFQQEKQRTYFSRRLNAQTILLTLDSGHVTPLDGEQLTWMKSELKRWKTVPLKLALYHVGLYPAFAPLTYAHMLDGRKHWLPVFDEEAVTLAFEHHDHTAKRTKPLRNGRVVGAGEGTIYVGDGGWGQSLTKPDLARDYLEYAESIRHFWRVDISASAASVTAIGQDGQPHHSFKVKR